LNSLESTLQKLSDDELIRMVYIVPDDYTVEGIECAKSILEARGVERDGGFLKQKVTNAYLNEVAEISKPKEQNQIQKLLSIETIVYIWRMFPVYFLWVSKGEISELFSNQSLFITLVVWAIIFSGLEWLLKKKKLKDVKMAEESIKKLKGKIKT
jgi:hypothetical protein